LIDSTVSHSPEAPANMRFLRESGSAFDMRHLSSSSPDDHFRAHLHGQQEGREQVGILRTRVDVHLDGEQEEDALEIRAEDRRVQKVTPARIVLFSRL